MSMPKTEALRSRKRIALRVLLAIVIAVMTLVALGALTVLGISEYVRLSTNEQIYQSADDLKDISDVDCVIVLGAGLKADGTPSHMLEDRIKVAVDVYNATGADYILMSGDRSGEYYDEPAAMRKYAESLGVDPSCILIDECGFSTYESMERADELFEFDKVIVITQKYHLYRALYIANTEEYEAVGVSSNLRPYSGQPLRELREILARVKDFFMCL